jgi:hypothetical protein
VITHSRPNITVWFAGLTTRKLRAQFLSFLQPSYTEKISWRKPKINCRFQETAKMEYHDKIYEKERCKS